MPVRMIRDGYLDSERYLGTGDSACLLWHRLLNLADDLGCVSVAPIFLRRRCYGSNPPSDGQLEKFLGELSDSDLIRLYEVDGARYAFIPRFGQRLQRGSLKHPMPPMQLLSGDSAALEKFNEIKEKSQKATVGQPVVNGAPTDAQPPMGSDVKRTDVKEEKKSGRARKPRTTLPEVSLEDYIATLKARGERMVADHAALWAYVAKVGLPNDFVGLAWFVFKNKYGPNGEGSEKRYADWRRVFLTAIKENWAKVWYFDSASGECRLTTVGEQAMRAAA